MSTLSLPGFTQWFPPRDHAFADACIADLTALGVRRIRTPIRCADGHPQADDWHAWLLRSLAERFEVLPVVVTAPLQTDEATPRWDADSIAALIRTHGAYFQTIELDTGCNSAHAWSPLLDWHRLTRSIADAAQCVVAGGKRLALAAPQGDITLWARALADHGTLQVADVIGLRIETSQPAWAGPRAVSAWAEPLARARTTLEALSCRADIWITDAGCHGPEHDFSLCIGDFLGACAAPAARVYWGTWRDPPERDAPSGLALRRGLVRADGRPRLLGRLLQNGLQPVQAVGKVQAAPAIIGRKPPLLITGGAGFIGCNLADKLAATDENVLVYDSLARPGVEENLIWLRHRHPRRVAVAIADIRDTGSLKDAVRDAAAVFHLAAQVAVTASMTDPAEDLQINLLGTFNLLEALRTRCQPCVFASTNKVYGELDGMALSNIDNAYQPTDDLLRRHGWSEAGRLEFRTPYGCSKGAADQYVLDYAGNFGVPTAVMRMSCIYGPRQRGTEDQGWVAHFALRALRNQDITIYGDGRQVRDILFVDDAVRAYIAAWRNIGSVAGQAFNLGGGPANAVSLLQLIGHIGQLLDRPVPLRFAPWRPNDQRYYVSDTRKLESALGWQQPMDWRRGVAILLDHLSDGRRHSAQPAAGLVSA